MPRQTPCAQTPLHRPGRHCSAARIVQQGTGGPGRSAAPAQGQQQVNSSRTEINIVVACKEACVLLAGQAVLFKRVHMNCHTCNWRSRSSYKLLLTKQPCLCTLFNNQKLGCILQCIAVSHVTPSQRQPLLHDSQRQRSWPAVSPHYSAQTASALLHTLTAQQPCQLAEPAQQTLAAAAQGLAARP